MNILQSFNSLISSPIDSRFVVESLGELQSMQNKYDGLMVYVKTKHTFFVYDSTFGVNTISEIPSNWKTLKEVIDLY